MKIKPYFLLLGKNRYTATQRFSQELNKQSIPFDVANYKDIQILSNNNKLEISIKGKDIKKYTHIIRKNVEDLAELNIRYLLSQYCQNHKIRLLNSNFLLKIPYYNKLSQMVMLSENKVPYLPSLYLTEGKYENIKNPFGYPVILKGHTGRVGKQVFLIKNESEMKNFLHNNKAKRTYILQKFSPLKEDLRLILIGGKVIGGWKRRAIETFKTTAGENEKMLYDNPTQIERSIAEKVAKLLNADYCAVDMMYLGKKPYVLEVNLNAGFKVYEEKLGAKVNVAKAIIDHMINSPKLKN